MNSTTELSSEEYKKKILELERELTLLKAQNEINEAKINAGIHCFEEGISALKRIVEIFDTAKGAME